MIFEAERVTVLMPDFMLKCETPTIPLKSLVSEHKSRFNF